MKNQVFLSAYLCDSCKNFIKDSLGNILGGINPFDFCGEASAYFFDGDMLALKLLDQVGHFGVSFGNDIQFKKLYQKGDK